MKDFTVVVPHYNRVARIEMMFWRLANGTTPKENYEVILVDGGTGDGVLECLWEEWKDQLDLMIISTRKGGWENPARPRNIGYREAIGKYCVMLDADYLPSEMLLEEFLKSHNEGHEYVWGYAIDSSEGHQDFMRGLEDDSFWLSSCVGAQEGRYQLSIETLFKGLSIPMDKWNKEPWLFSVDTKTMQDICGYDEDFKGWGKEDSDMFLRLMYVKGGLPVKNENASVIHMYHAAAGPMGQRDSRLNTSILNAKKKNLGRNYKRNQSRIWGDGGEILYNYREEHNEDSSIWGCV